MTIDRESGSGGLSLTRRSMVGAIGLLPLAFARRARAAVRAIRRRARPGQPGWPAPAEWAALKQRLTGELVRPSSPWAHCLENDRATCARDMHDLKNPFYLGDQPGGTQVSGWLGAWRPAPSAYAVAVASAADVAAAVDFARAHDLRVAVKGGGHSYQGTSNVADSLLVWTRRMRDIQLHDAFVPAGCAGRVTPTPAVSVGAGAVWIDVYDAVTTKAGRYVQGGGCATVGVAGLIQSGGFGSFSKRFGLAAAGLLEAEIVTADGCVRVVNACRDPDLFWALKGGGGGTFGVVTRLTLRTRDLPERLGGMNLVVKARDERAFGELAELFFAHYAAALLDPHWGESVTFTPDFQLKASMVVQGLDDAQAAAAWAPFVAAVTARSDAFSIVEPFEAHTRPARAWWDVLGRKARGSTSMTSDDRPGASPVHAWWSGDQEQVSIYLHGYESVWMPASLLAARDRPRLAAALVRASRSTPVALHFNKGLAGAPEAEVAAARAAAINPAVCDAFALAIVAAGGPPPFAGVDRPADADATAAANARAVRAAGDALRAVVPRPASYLSEADFFSARWAEEYWGPHAARLARIKRQYDPGDLFIVHHGVGSERWQDDGFERKG